FCLFCANGDGRLPTLILVSPPARGCDFADAGTAISSTETTRARPARRRRCMLPPLWLSSSAGPEHGRRPARTGQTLTRPVRHIEKEWARDGGAGGSAPGPTRSAAGERATDDDALDLRGALEDRVDLGVPVPLLHREVLDEAVTAQDLDGLLGDEHGRLAGL